MREIKFRAWCTFVDNDYPAYMAFFTLYDGIPNVGTAKDIMQYTGQHDKHGVDIYDGDILRSAGGKEVRVQWNDDIAGWDLYGSYHSLEVSIIKGWELEVIGNIYENGELLNE
jgi:hypothetical protein